MQMDLNKSVIENANEENISLKANQVVSMSRRSPKNVLNAARKRLGPQQIDDKSSKEFALEPAKRMSLMNEDSKAHSVFSETEEEPKKQTKGGVDKPGQDTLVQRVAQHGKDDSTLDGGLECQSTRASGMQRKKEGSTQDGVKEETVSEAASDTDTISGGGEVLSGGKEEEEEVKPLVSNYFETRLNRSAVKYNRLPVSPEFAKSLDLCKDMEKDWTVADHQGWSWPISFHQEGGFEMIKGWRPVINALELEVGSVLLMFRPDEDEDAIEIRKVDTGLTKESVGQKFGDLTLGEIVPDETISSTSGDISAVRHIEYKGKKHMAFLKKLAIGAVRPYGSNPPRLELHHKAGQVLLFLQKKMEVGNFHCDCQLKYNDSGDFHVVKVTIRNYIVLRWGQPSYKRYYSLQEGDTIMFYNLGEGIIEVNTEQGSEEVKQKKRAKPGEGQRGKRKLSKLEGSPSTIIKAQQSQSPSKGKSGDANLQAVTKLAKDMIQTGRGKGGKITRRKIPKEGNGLNLKVQTTLDDHPDIESLLRAEGLQSFQDIFKKHSVTLKTLGTGLVTEDHLREMELPVGPRLEILSLVEKTLNERRKTEELKKMKEQYSQFSPEGTRFHL